MDEQVVPLNILYSEHTERGSSFRLVPQIVEDVEGKGDGASNDGEDSK